MTSVISLELRNQIDLQHLLFLIRSKIAVSIRDEICVNGKVLTAIFSLKDTKILDMTKLELKIINKFRLRYESKNEALKVAPRGKATDHIRSARR